MMGGGMSWSQSFSVVDKSPGKDLIKRDNVFKLSVSKPLGASIRDKKFNIQLVFDLDKYPDVKENESYMDESINRIIVKLLERIFGSKIYTGRLYGDNENVDFPSKKMAIKAHKQNKLNEILSGKSLDKFITNEGKVGKSCTINMSIRKDEQGRMSLFLDDYTEISLKPIVDHQFGEQILDNFRFESKVQGPHEYKVYKWLQKTTDLKITMLETPFTEETSIEATLKTKLDELKDTTDNEYIFYQLIHDIKNEETSAGLIEGDTKPILKKVENKTINFKNGDNFVGMYEISAKGDIQLMEGKYTWADGTVYQGSYASPNYCDDKCKLFKDEGEYTWPGNTTTTYKGSFMVDFIRPTSRKSIFVEDKGNGNQLWIFDFNSGFLTKVDAAQVAPAEKQPIESSQVDKSTLPE
jgi:hypothetical protein